MEAQRIEGLAWEMLLGCVCKDCVSLQANHGKGVEYPEIGSPSNSGETKRHASGCVHVEDCVGWSCRRIKLGEKGRWG